jgi:RNA polymerase sigma-70 factor, ECF subfamily
VSQHTDTDLVIRAQRGDETAFANLVTGSYSRLHLIAHGILRDREPAEDAIQQALLTIWRELPRLRDAARFEAWSYRLLVNACHAEARQARRWLPGIRREWDAPATATEDVQAIVDRDQLERGFRGLSVDQRAVIVLQYYLGLSPREAAEALGVPVGTVHSRLHHGLRALRARLAADERVVAPPRESTEATR